MPFCCTVARATLIIATLFTGPFATGPAAAAPYQVETLTSGLDRPWSVAELSDGHLLITEKGGRLLILDSAGGLTPVLGMPPIFDANQGGLLEVVLHPQFDSNDMIYVSYAGGDDKGNRTTVARGFLRENRVEDLEAILEVSPNKEGSFHYGGKMVFLPDGTLIVSVGEGFSYREQAQSLSWELGKLLRVNADGSAPVDNPFPAEAPRVYSYGHRNPQGLIFDAGSQRILMHEHGPKGGDELNVIEAGKNYGWPAITYGVDYSGAVISPFTEADGMEQPMTYWVPSIGPSGLAIYRGDDFPDWEGDLLLGSLINGEIRRLQLDGNTVIDDSPVFPEVTGRVRDVRVLKDGSIVALTDEGNVFHISS
jgi:glucose/arabinose dehydrogenase